MGGIDAVRQRHALTEYRLVRKVLGRLGYHVVPGNYYSPIPVLKQLPASTWSEPAEMPGVDWDLDAQLRFLSSDLGPLLAELDAPSDPPGNAWGYHLENEFFNAMDAEVLHAVIRAQRPRRVLEFGSGFSTLVIAGALDRNRAEGDESRHSVFDPHPSPVLDRVRDRFELAALPATEVPVSVVDELGAGDLLFIDTTHTVRPGGDVIHLVLGAMPRLAPGVLVQIHDFFRPFEYPRLLLERFGACWQEHHLVQALLAFNSRIEVLCANHALARQRTAEVTALIPSLRPQHLPSSLWLRTR